MILFLCLCLSSLFPSSFVPYQSHLYFASDPQTAEENAIPRAGQAGVGLPEFTYKQKPKYPQIGIDLKLQGYVVLEAIFRKDGSIDQIKVLRGLGKGKFGFEDAAVDALKKWRFKPGQVNGVDADIKVTLKIDFTLEK